ncbi:hypothetical protein [Pelobacter propionicus]|nr:hypothetical protein [Pelobacter propionicus]
MSTQEEKTRKALDSLSRYCKAMGYQGWDNFDGLNSRIVDSAPFHYSYILRLIWIQFFKRFPLNLRKLTLVPKGYNPKGLALFVSGLVYSGQYDEAKSLIDILMKLSSPGYNNVCWGYNFDWQSRKFLTPKSTPNLVVTVFVVNALLDYYKATGDHKYFDLAVSGCNFYLDNLILFEDPDSLCFQYMPGSRGKVYNVSMLGATALARVYQINRERALYDKSKKAMIYAIRALQKDYSWTYAENRKFIDNFHTGFNLVSLCKWMEYTDDYCWERELKGAYNYYLKTFWLENWCPKYYHNSLYPIDIHCSAQGIVTLLKLMPYNTNSIELAGKIADWAINNMQDNSGYFYYQKTRFYTNSIPYMRWSQAWMFYALSMLNYSYTQ